VCAYIVAKPYVVVVDVDVHDHADAKFSGIKLPTYNTIQYNTMENLHSKTDKHTVSLI